MSWLKRDLHYGLREMLRRPGFSALAVLTLAAGIGPVTVMFSVIYSVLLNPFPYAQPRRMVDVVIQDTEQSSGGIGGALTIPEFRAYVDESDVFEDAVGTETTLKQRRTEFGTADIAVGAVTPNLFQFLGVKPLLGRVSTPADAKAGAPQVALLSYQSWMSNFGGDPAVIGRTILLDNNARVIIGIMPSNFAWNTADIWVPDRADYSDAAPLERGFWLQARLTRGISIEQAQARLNVIARRLAKLYPKRYPRKFTIKVLTVIDWVVGKFRTVLYTLFGAVGPLLLIACCTVANMLLSRATSRQREIAVRAALGAGRFQILRQLLVESSILSLSGGMLGVALAYLGTRAVSYFMPPNTIPVETEIAVRAPVLIFTIAATAVTTLLFGVAPALYAMRVDLARGLSAAGKGEGLGARHSVLRDLLVVAEVALSLILAVGAGALMHSFLAMLNVDLGFNPHNIIAVRANVSNGTQSQQRQFVDLAVARLGSLPGVVAAAASSGFPFYGGASTPLDIVGTIHTQEWRGVFAGCDRQYFSTIGYRFLRGRPFSASDVTNARKVAVVNQTLVKRYLGDQNPLGQHVRIGSLQAASENLSEPVFEITGVVADVRNRGLEEPTVPEVFIPATSTGVVPSTILIRTSADSRKLLETVRNELRALNKNGRVLELDTLDGLMGRYSYARPRFSVFLMGAFAGVGLLLVAAGVYGVMSYAVSQRTREIGIRIALGADRAQVFGEVFAAALRLIGFGLFVGLAGSLFTNRLIAGQVWTITPFDPIILLGSVAVILTLGFTACYLPALRATRVQPIVALRYD